MTPLILTVLPITLGVLGAVTLRFLDRGRG